MIKEGRLFLNRREFMKLAAVSAASLFLPACGPQAPAQPRSTLSPKEVSEARENNRRSAQATATYLEDNPDVLKEDILKIPERLWTNAARVTGIDWTLDKNYKMQQEVAVVSTPYSGSCVIVGPDLLATAGHLLHAPGFKPSSITLDWPQGEDDSIRGVSVPEPFQEMRQNQTGVKLEVVSAAHIYDENDPGAPDMGLIRLKTPIPSWSPMYVKNYSDTDQLYALLMSTKGDDPQKSGVIPFGVEGQPYIPAPLEVSYTYPGPQDSLFLVAPGPGNKGESGTGVSNSKGELIGIVSYSWLAQDEPVFVITATDAVYENLLQNLH